MNCILHIKKCLIIDVLILTFLTSTVVAQPVEVRKNPAVESYGASLAQHKTAVNALEGFVSRKRIIENIRYGNFYVNTVDKTNSTIIPPKDDSPPDNPDPTYRSGPHFGLEESRGPHIELDAEPGEHKHKEGMDDHKPTRFCFWPVNTFDSRIHNNDDKQFTLINTALSGFVTNINHAKEKFLTLTTTYRDNPLTDDERAKLNYLARTIRPQLKSEYTSQCDTITTLESQMRAQLDSFAERSSRDDEANVVVETQDKSDRSTAEKGKISNRLNLLYRVFRDDYEKRIEWIGKSFSSDIEKIRDIIKESIVNEGTEGTEMVIRINKG